MPRSPTSPGWLPEADSPRRVKVDLRLKLLHRVLGLDYLHFGLWNGEPLDRSGLEAAQRRYAERLLDWIPDGTVSVLEVGTGTGALGGELVRRGCEVEGLSPDPYQAQLFAGRVGRPFHLVRFEEFVPARRYDLVLMGESAQYVWLHALFQAVRQASPGGHLLIADLFAVAPETGTGRRSPHRKGGHPLDRFLVAAAEEGFELLRQEDVTAQAAPTLALAERWLERYVEPALQVVREDLARRHPRLLGIVLWLMRRPLARAASQRRLLDAAELERGKRYLFLLLRVPGEAPSRYGPTVTSQNEVSPDSNPSPKRTSGSTPTQTPRP